MIDLLAWMVLLTSSGAWGADQAPSPHSDAATDRGKTFEQLDVNRDGRLSMPEAAADPELLEVFSRADRNGDGYLDASEYAKRPRPPRP